MDARNTFSDRITGGLPQKGILSYGISNNRQNPFAGAAHDAVFNTWRRFYSQVFYWGPAAVIGYYTLNWAIERYVNNNTLDDTPFHDLKGCG